jgi:4-amino-4-deoxy-L-arabinose transferase-like glycosyltransferase
MENLSNHREMKSENHLSLNWPLLLGLALVGVAVFFHRLGFPGLMDPDEGRYAEIAREMWVLKDWLIPHLNFVPYLEKPPLVYWLTALSFGALGETEFAARLPAALSALGVMYATFALGREFWGPRGGFISALVLATSGGFVVLGRLLTLDMVLTLFFTLGLGLGYLALSRGRRELWIWAYAALALATLTKGPVALVLAALVWGAWCMILDRTRWRSLLQLRYWLLLVFIVLPWFIAVAWRYPEFFRYFLLEHHLGRFLTPAFHGKPVYYFLPVLAGLMLPWTWLLPWCLAKAWRRADPDKFFCVIWAGVVLAFFSFSRGKLAPYVLPALPPLALLAGQGLAALDQARWGEGENRALRICLAAWAGAGWLLLAAYAWPPEALSARLAAAQPLLPYLAFPLAIFALTPTLSLIWRRKEALLLGALLLAAAIPPVMEKVSLTRSPRAIGQVVRSEWQPGAALIGFQHYSQVVSFYSGQPFHLLMGRTELEFGRSLARGNNLFFTDAKELAAYALTRPKVFIYLKTQDLPGLEQALPGRFSLLARYKDAILVDYSGDEKNQGKIQGSMLDKTQNLKPRT